MFLVVNLAYAMDEEGGDSDWALNKSSDSRRVAKRKIIISDDEDECVPHIQGGTSSSKVAAHDDRDAAISSFSKKRKGGQISESDYEDASNDRDESSHSGSEENNDTIHWGGYFEKLIAEVKSGVHDDRKALHAAVGAEQSMVIDCFKKALKDKRLTKAEIRPFYTSREDKNALWDGIVSLIKQKKTKAEIFTFYNERCRRGESFSDGQFRRVLQKFVEEGRIVSQEARPFYRSIETKQEILNGIVSRIKERAERTAIFAFYNANCRDDEKLTNDNFNGILKRLVAEESITHDEAALFRHKAKLIGYQVDTKQLIISFIEEYRLANDPTSSWKELYDKFAQSDFSPEIGIVESTFCAKIRKLVDEMGTLSEEQFAFIENCKNKKQSYPVERPIARKQPAARNTKPGEFKNSDPKGAVKAFAQAVRSGGYEDRQALVAGTGYAPASVNGLFCEAKKEGVLTEEEILQFNTREQNAFRLQVAGLVKEKKTEEEILDFCQQHEGAREKTEHYLSRNYLRKILGYLYEEGELTTNDTAYLKMDGTVVNRNGGTKNYIVQFLTTRALGTPTNTRKELADEFNAFTRDEFNMRSIDVKTFATHVKELINKGDKLTDAQVAFFNACKEQQQQDGYVPTSKRFYR